MTSTRRGTRSSEADSDAAQLFPLHQTRRGLLDRFRPAIEPRGRLFPSSSGKHKSAKGAAASSPSHKGKVNAQGTTTTSTSCRQEQSTTSQRSTTATVLSRSNSVFSSNASVFSRSNSTSSSELSSLVSSNLSEGTEDAKLPTLLSEADHVGVSAADQDGCEKS
mmetsp:Transcript_10469/g.25612  ORF Transcript_10469/g.25612 Transcript_10469/m.25612 type:complete len:164 (+) Transcript_10469:164-655(+)